MKQAIRNQINRANAQHSTGPLTPEGRQRSAMNAFKHGLTGNHMLLQGHEREAYNRLTTQLVEDLDPQTELELQLVQKIIDCHTRLNRIAAIDANLLNVHTAFMQEERTDSDALDDISSQARAWTQHADHFDKLGRYEARISRQLLQYTKELERLLLCRKEAGRKQTQPAESPATSPKLASFRNIPTDLTDPAPVHDSKPDGNVTFIRDPGAAAPAEDAHARR